MVLQNILYLDYIYLYFENHTHMMLQTSADVSSIVKNFDQH